MSTKEQRIMLSHFIRELEIRASKMNKIVGVFKNLIGDYTDDNAREIHKLTTEITTLDRQQEDICFGNYKFENPNLLKDINIILGILAKDQDLYMQNITDDRIGVYNGSREIDLIDLTTRLEETHVQKTTNHKKLK
jgi:hypothetical protein